jgi:hypothetical protein
MQYLENAIGPKFRHSVVDSFQQHSRWNECEHRFSIFRSLSKKFSSLCMPRLSGHDQPQLESDAFSLVSAYLDLHSVGAHNDNTKVFMPSIVWVDAESLIGHLEANPIACESSHDSGHVGIFALGAINCAYDTPSIMDAISRRWTIPSLGGCRAPAENRSLSGASRETDDIDWAWQFDAKTPSNFQKTCQYSEKSGTWLFSLFAFGVLGWLSLKRPIAG